MMANTNGNLSSDNIRTIKEWILDEQKLVTYISLSKDLCVHVNEAKALLKKAIQEILQNNKSIHLNVTYLISGLTSNNAGLTTVCPESELDTCLSTFKTVFYQHIYSVCQGCVVDNAALVCINTFEDILLCAGLIKGTSCIKRSSDEIVTLKSNSQKTANEIKPVLPTTGKKEIKEKICNISQVGNKANDVVKVHETKSEPMIKSEIISPKKGTSMIVNDKPVSKNGTKPSKGIAGFFTKSNSAPSTKSAKVTTETSKDIENPPDIKKEVKLGIKQEECMDVDEEINIKEIKEEPPSAKKSKSKKNSTLSQIKKNAKIDKKRKRVLHVSDSESDNDPFADEKLPNHESDDEIPPTPTVNTIKITSGILNPKKRRKLVDKTYTDEEGYILTRKEEVYESCSEEEVEILKTEAVQIKVEKENFEQSNKVKIELSPKEKKAKNNKKKVSPPQKGKQTNIMNFFKKV